MNHSELARRAFLSPNARERLDAVIALGDSEDPDAVPFLSVALKDRDPNVRCAACGALTRVGGEAAVSPLLHASKDRHMLVRHAAVSGLSRLGDPRACPVLIRALRDAGPLVRAAAVSGLGALGDVHAVQHLWSALVDADLTHAAAEAIIRIAQRDGACVQLLQRSLPSFRQMYKMFPAEGEGAGLAAALARIEASLPLRGVPIPSTTASTSGEDLPRVAAPPPSAPEQLPVVDPEAVRRK